VAQHHTKLAQIAGVAIAAVGFASAIYQPLVDFLVFPARVSVRLDDLDDRARELRDAIGQLQTLTVRGDVSDADCERRIERIERQLDRHFSEVK
jgi:hypothetical protein